jgi:16S rRNA processing protein RimM
MTETDWAILARLMRSQGRHGEILAEIFTDFPERFAERKRLFLIASETSPTPICEMTLERHWLHKGRVVLKFAGVDSINDTEALRGLLVAIPASERAPLTDDSIYISDLIGCEVFDLAAASEEQQRVGEIIDVERDSALLVVKPARGGEVLIPFAKTYLANIDLASRRIEMRLPAGLLDINAPLSEEERQALSAAETTEEGE